MTTHPTQTTPKVTSTLESLTVFITGASSGIGASLAREVSKYRVKKLCIVARNQAQLESIASECKALGAQSIEIIPYDLTKDLNNETLTSAIQTSDWVINNAGIGEVGPFTEIPYDIQRRTIQLNIAALTEISYFAAVSMKKRGYGKIINIGSLAGEIAIPRFSVYSASKFYVNQFSKALRIELEGTGVHVLTGIIGGVNTPFLEKGKIDAKKAPPLMTPEFVAKQVIQAALKNKNTVIPGFGNRIGWILTQILPFDWPSRVMGKVYEKLDAH
jgi:short-subunit dehydrogenase